MFLAKQRGQVSLGSREANWEVDGGGKARRCSGGEGYWQRKGGAGREDWGPHPGACPGHLSGFKWQGVGRTGTAVVGLGPCSLLSSQSLRMPDAVQAWRDLSAAPPTPYCTPGRCTPPVTQSWLEETLSCSSLRSQRPQRPMHCDDRLCSAGAHHFTPSFTCTCYLAGALLAAGAQP